MRLARILHENIDFNRFSPPAWRDVSGGGESGSPGVDFVARTAISGSFSRLGEAGGGVGASASPGNARPGWESAGMRPYPGLSRAAAVWNSVWRGCELDSSSRTRRVLRSTTAPTFSNFSRIVPT